MSQSTTDAVAIGVGRWCRRTQQAPTGSKHACGSAPIETWYPRAATTPFPTPGEQPRPPARPPPGPLTSHNTECARQLRNLLASSFHDAPISTSASTRLQPCLQRAPIPRASTVSALLRLATSPSSPSSPSSSPSPSSASLHGAAAQPPDVHGVRQRFQQQLQPQLCVEGVCGAVILVHLHGT